ncbi:DUF6441 family protein [Tritonibacter mobilis]|uniref:DUF6441 family protein n=1 Tax=Tritonibacter mobilis TaxID=379347 RepID=UPI0039A5D785
MRFDFRPEGSGKDQMEEHIRNGERAVKRGVKKAGDGLKKDWRGQVVAAGLGRRLANTVRGAVFPPAQDSLRAAALVYVRPGGKRGASAAEVVDAHDRGVLIRNRSAGLVLAVPIGKHVQRMRGRRGQRITPGEWEQKTGKRLEYVPRKGKPPLLVDTGIPLRRLDSDSMSSKTTRYKRWERGGKKRARTWKPIFVLVPQVKLRKKMDLDRDSDKWIDRLPGLIVQNWKG